MLSKVMMNIRFCKGKLAVYIKKTIISEIRLQTGETLVCKGYKHTAQ